jgi:hypothetical protein
MENLVDVAGFVARLISAALCRLARSPCTRRTGPSSSHRVRRFASHVRHARPPLAERIREFSRRGERHFVCVGRTPTIMGNYTYFVNPLDLYCCLGAGVGRNEGLPAACLLLIVG